MYSNDTVMYFAPVASIGLDENAPWLLRTDVAERVGLYTCVESIEAVHGGLVQVSQPFAQLDASSNPVDPDNVVTELGVLIVNVVLTEA
jgi:hypothetical protein